MGKLSGFLLVALSANFLLNFVFCGTAQTRPGNRIMHPAFASAGKKKGLEIWRVENFEPVAYPKNDYGKFFTGDSYIVLNTMEDRNKKLSWDVHFWLGLETSQDESGAAAIFTVQLDDLLGGGPVQHREVQEHESQLFLNYFKSGIRYMPGGVASGFKKTEVNAAGEKRLFQVKGKKNIRVRQVDLAISSMNKGDCFILDAGNKKIYVYVGQKSKRVEKMKATSAANQIRDQDHNGRATVEIVDEFSSEADKIHFFEVLGSGSPESVPEESTSEDDEAFERSDESKTTLYTVSDASGTLKVDPIAQKPLKQEMLNTNDCFILDTGSGIYAWVGKKATEQEKKQAMSRAQGFLQTKKYPSWTKVTRVVEGAEPAPFKQYFFTWRDHGATHSRLIRAANDEDSDIPADEFDVANFHKLQKNGGRAIGFMPDNGEGDAEVWRVEDFELVPVPVENYGFFFGGDSYVIKYEYRSKRGGSGYVIYFWQGLTSTVDEKASSALHATRLANEANGKAMQVRVVQGFEPRHFLKIFKGKVVVFTGGKSSGFKNIHDHDTYDVDGTRLFRIRGTCAEDVRATQVEETASALASDDVFILETPANTYIWMGKGANDFEQSMGESVSKTISPDRSAIVIQEGEEPEEFWNSLGGKAEYDTEIDPPGAPFLDPRLFHCTIKSNGRFRVEEITAFEQDDLDPDDIMVLDGGDECYVWVGKGSTEEEKAKSLDMAREYIRTDPTERSEETVPLIVVPQGGEPRSFKRLFPAWSDFLWEVRGLI